MSERAGLATKTLSHEAAQRKTLWSFVSWGLSGEILLNTLLPHYPIIRTFARVLFSPIYIGARRLPLDALPDTMPDTPKLQGRRRGSLSLCHLFEFHFRDSFPQLVERIGDFDSMPGE